MYLSMCNICLANEETEKINNTNETEMLNKTMGISGPGIIRYAEMEEDCRQKKSTLTPAPRGREEVSYHSRCH